MAFRVDPRKSAAPLPLPSSRSAAAVALETSEASYLAPNDLIDGCPAVLWSALGGGDTLCLPPPAAPHRTLNPTKAELKSTWSLRKHLLLLSLAS